MPKMKCDNCKLPVTHSTEHLCSKPYGYRCEDAAWRAAAEKRLMVASGQLAIVDWDPIGRAAYMELALKFIADKPLWSAATVAKEALDRAGASG